MQAATQTTDRLDALDVEAFEAMIASKPFHTLKLRVAGELSRAQSDCESLLDETELRRAQGAARALRAVLSLPDMILKSIQWDKDKRNK